MIYDTENTICFIKNIFLILSCIHSFLPIFIKYLTNLTLYLINFLWFNKFCLFFIYFLWLHFFDSDQYLSFMIYDIWYRKYSIFHKKYFFNFIMYSLFNKKYFSITNMGYYQNKREKIIGIFLKKKQGPDIKIYQKNKKN